MNRDTKSLINQLLRRHQDKWWVGLIIVALLILAPEVLEGNIDERPTQEEIPIEKIYNFNGENFEIFPKQVKIPVDLDFVNDGDTIRVDINGHQVGVRYLIIDAPEMNYKEGDPEPYAQEASRLNEAYLENADQVYLEFDVGPYTDDYQRALAYVYADDVMLNEELIREGLATVRYVNPPNTSYEGLLRDAQADAQESGVNLWSE